MKLHDICRHEKSCWLHNYGTEPQSQHSHTHHCGGKIIYCNFSVNNCGSRATPVAPAPWTPHKYTLPQVSPLSVSGQRRFGHLHVKNHTIHLKSRSNTTRKWTNVNIASSRFTHGISWEQQKSQNFPSMPPNLGGNRGSSAAADAHSKTSAEDGEKKKKKPEMCWGTDSCRWCVCSPLLHRALAQHFCAGVIRGALKGRDLRVTHPISADLRKNSVFLNLCALLSASWG